MSLKELVQKVFAEDGAIDRLSFLNRELFYTGGTSALVVLPLSEKTIRKRTLSPVQEQKDLATQGFAVVAEVDGYYVGGMNKADCKCGRASIFVHSEELSKEPGRKNQVLFSELGLSRVLTDYQSRQVPICINGVYRLTLSGTQLRVCFKEEQLPYLKNRTYEVWKLATQKDADAYRTAFARLKKLKNESRFDTSIDKSIFGDYVFCMLSASYFMLRPDQEKEAARMLITGTFGDC